MKLNKFVSQIDCRCIVIDSRGAGSAGAARSALAGSVSEAACGESAYLTDLEVKFTPPLLRLETEHGGEHRAK